MSVIDYEGMALRQVNLLRAELEKTRQDLAHARSEKHRAIGQLHQTQFDLMKLKALLSKLILDVTWEARHAGQEDRKEAADAATGGASQGEDPPVDRSP